MTALFSIDCHACGAKNTIDAETMRRVERLERAAIVADIKFHESWDEDDDYTPPPLKECSVEDCIGGLNRWEEARGTCDLHTPDRYGITPSDCYCSQGSDNSDVDICHLHWAALGSPEPAA